jgi:small subunit ribosomal protein S16
VLRIRLRRVGAKKQPLYRLVIAENEWPRDGRFLEIVGRYNPRTNPATIEVDEARILHWLGNGAQPTESVHQLLDKVGTLGRFSRLQKGEALEALLAEAKLAAETASSNTSRRTQSDKFVPSTKKKAPAAAAETTPAA